MDNIQISYYGILLTILLYLLYSNVAIFGAIAVLSVTYHLIRKNTAQYIQPTKDGVLITGCDTGFGNATARRLDNLGFTVFACCLGDGKDLEKSSCTGRLHVLQMDVTNEEHIANAVTRVSEILKNNNIGLWSVINNAGIYYCGETEFVTIDMFKKLLDVNLLGMFRVTKAFVPFLRKTKGRLVNVTSVLARMTLPLNCLYCSTKHATNAFSEAVRLDMAKFGVKVCVIQPCDFSLATKFILGNADVYKKNFDQMWNQASDEIRETYGRDYWDTVLNSIIVRPQNTCRTMEPVLSAMVDAITNEQPRKTYYVAGTGSGVYYDKYHVLGLMRTYLPEAVVDAIVDKFFTIKLRQS